MRLMVKLLIILSFVIQLTSSDYWSRACPFLLDTKPLRDWGKETLGPPKKFPYLIKAGDDLIIRRPIGHTKATKSHVLSRDRRFHTTFVNRHWRLITCLFECVMLWECRDGHHMLFGCVMLQVGRGEYYTMGLMGTFFETVTEACMECLKNSLDSSMWYGWSDIYYNSSLEIMQFSTHISYHNFTIPTKLLSSSLFVSSRTLLVYDGYKPWRTFVVKQMRSKPIQFDFAASRVTWDPMVVYDSIMIFMTPYGDIDLGRHWFG